MTRTLCLLVLLGLTLNATALAQPANLSGMSGMPNHSFVRTGELTMYVDVWGSLNSPGIYEVPQGTRLSTLISWAGGPPLTGDTSELERTFILRLYRGAPGARTVVFETVMENGIQALNEDPVLESGDLLVAELETDEPFGWRDAFSIANTVLSVALVALRVRAFF